MSRMKRTDARPAQEGWKPVLPGIYEDAQGYTHLSVPELLAVFEVQDTPENRQIVVAQAQRVVAEMWLGTAVEVRE